MSLAVTHFAVGASLTLLLVWFLVPSCRYLGSVGVLGGIWSLVPDLHYVSPVHVTELRGIKHSVWGDVFWFHRTMDGWTQGRGSRGTAGLAILLLLGVMVFVEWQDHSPILKWRRT